MQNNEALAFLSAARREVTARRQEVAALGHGAKASAPRHWYLEAARLALDTFDPDRLPLLADLADQVAAELLTVPVDAHFRADADDEVVIDDERRRFVARVDALASSDLSAIEPLAYRRSLTAAESAAWLRRITERWPVSEKSWWDPITTGVAGTLVLSEAAFWQDVRSTEPGPATLAVRRALVALDVHRVIELREWGPEHEVAIDACLPTYTGAEGLFFSATLEWLIYACHEGATAVGGTIVPALQQTWPAWERSVWTGSSSAFDG